ncbi:hypothetical protein LIER_10106 [Lithospermum erythrorhizon]|uniref:Transposase-associated domain-containing protein n=1 Tax=Lithospermum erythrorhizon TaxID=34254 RepID=A0AAV3PI93_LITER
MFADCLSQEYENGVTVFINMALKHAKDKDRIPYPYWNCLNINTVDKDELEEHLICVGIDTTYTCWTKHGESRAESVFNQFEFNFGHEDSVNSDIGDDVEQIPIVLEDELVDHTKLFERLKKDAN